MICDSIRAHLWEYYDDACAPEVRDQVVAHLAACLKCQDSLDEWIAVSTQVFEKGRSRRAPPFLWTRVLAAIEARETESSGAWWLQWRWMSHVAAVLTLVVSLGAAYLYHESAGSYDGLFEGQPSQHRAIQAATRQGGSAGAGFELALGDVE